MTRSQPQVTNGTTRTMMAATFAVVILASFPLHELGHWVGFSLAGIPAAISLNHTYFTERWEPSLAGAAGGPVATIALAWIGVYLVLRRGRLQPLGFALAVVMPFTRLATYAICAAIPRAMAINDEGVMALDCGWPTWSWVWILLPFLVAPWVVAWRAAPGSPVRKLGRFGGTAVAWVVLGLVLEAGVLDPRLFPDAAARELVMPHAPR
ncbi:hypothetical protein [Anaeromyxobacter terrae]|uniref:hypothetical protein n=1 Tax=Anaeromyxobacter terrae TaxID=2925406 RepID=UPI001F568789|nr:hypothetical protein [Anaeromyxobacter sp. SG22]